MTIAPAEDKLYPALMRIISGQLRGRRLIVPREGVRPTADRVREALFSMLGPGWAGRRVLDAFAGTGALGFESLSRGAAEATFIESNRSQAQQLRKTAEAWGLSDKVQVLPGDAMAMMRRCRKQGASFDLIFLDPPYDLELLPEALEAALPLLAEDGVLVAEHRKKSECPCPQGLAIRSQRSYASTTLSFLHHVA